MSNGPRDIIGGSSTSQVRAPGFMEQPLAEASRFATAQFRGNTPESFVQRQGRDLVGQTLRGDFLLPDSNPYLQATFDRGADAVQKRLDTQFAGAGRNIGASAAPARQELSDLASNIFGGSYQAERDRMQNALAMSSRFDPLNQFIERIGLLAPAAGRDSHTLYSEEKEKKASPLDRALDIGRMIAGVV